jgi:HlyD family secretion protein
MGEFGATRRDKETTMRWKVTGLGLAVLIFAIIGGVIGRRADAPRPMSVADARVDAPRVATVTVRTAEVAQSIEVTGTVKASMTADLAPKVMSKVALVAVKEGDRVRAGQVLVRLEAGDLAAQVRQAEAAVLSARAALAQAQTGAAIQETQSSTRVAQAQAALQQAREQLSLVREGSRRQQKLQADEAVRQAEAGRAQAGEGIRQAEAALAAARAQLSLVREGSRSQQKLQADAAVRQAEASLKTAQATYNRFKPLVEEGVITRQRFDEITLQRDLAQSQYDTARQQASLVYEGARSQEVQQAEEGVRQAEAALRMAQQKEREAQAAARSAAAQRDLTYEGSRSQEIRQAEEQVRQAEEALRMAKAATGETRMKAENVQMLRAQVTQADAGLTAARVQLAYATITAPFSGIVIRRLVDPGAMASPGVPVLTLEDPSGFRLEATVPESAMEGVRRGDTVTVTVDALGRALVGRIAQIVPSADPASRTFIVKVRLPRGAPLSAGLFGRVKLAAGRRRGLFVPAAALWHRESLVGVVVIEAGIAHRRLVTVGSEEAGKVEILSGLRDGEILAARDVERIADGAAVVAGGTLR